MAPQPSQRTFLLPHPHPEPPEMPTSTWENHTISPLRQIWTWSPSSQGNPNIQRQLQQLRSGKGATTQGEGSKNVVVHVA